MTIEFTKADPWIREQVEHARESLESLKDDFKVLWLMSNPDSDAEDAFQSILNKLSNVEKALDYEFPKEMQDAEET